MDSLLATLAVYRLAFQQGGRIALRNSAVMASVFVYLLLLVAALSCATFLGLFGGILMAFVSAACIGSFLHLVETMVRTSRVTLADFRQSFGAYLWDILGVNFVLWLGWRIVEVAVSGAPQEAALIRSCIWILVLVFFNAVPELIYLRHHSLLGLLTESYQFISENWVEWFPPNLIMLGIVVGIMALPAGTPALETLRLALLALFAYLAMVIRGFLFAELSTTSRRGRAFRHRSGR